MSAQFILRVNSQMGQNVRFYFDSSSSTLMELKQEINNKYGIPNDQQILSKTIPSNPNFIESNNDTKLCDIGLKHGDRIWLVMGKNHIQNIKNKQQQIKAQKQTLNNNKGIYSLKNNNNNNNNNNIDSMNIDLDEVKSNDNNGSYKLKPIKRNNGKWVTMSTSKYVNDPKHKIEDKGAKHKSFHEWIQERQKKFKNKQWLIDPPKYNYASVPIKNNLEFKKLPQNAVIKRQEYRHCDVLSFQDPVVYQQWRKLWLKNTNIQKAAFLIGKYELREDTLFNKDKNKNKKLMYALVYAIYEPPQKGFEKYVKILKDPNENNINNLLNSLELQRVGLVVTTKIRSGDKYHGDIFMSGYEIFESSKLQYKYRNKTTDYSKFVTLICYPGAKDAQAFQVSDQGVAMIRYGLIEADTNDYGFMKVKDAPQSTYVPAVINENKTIKPRKSFLPDALLVNIISSAPKKIQPLFQYIHFPPNGDLKKFREHLLHHKDKEYHVKFSDFNLLCFLTKILDSSLVSMIAKHVTRHKRFDDNAKKKITKALKGAGL